MAEDPDDVDAGIQTHVPDHHRLFLEGFKLKWTGRAQGKPDSSQVPPRNYGVIDQIPLFFHVVTLGNQPPRRYQSDLRNINEKLVSPSEFETYRGR